MKYGFYFRLYRIFKSEWICCVLADLLYALYLCKYIIKKMFLKKEHVNLSYEQACEVVEALYRKPVSNPEYINPKVKNELDLSIVIPVYNHVDILENNIESVLNQKTKYNYEVILVDDGSTDGAREFLLNYKDKNNVKLIFQENGGIGAARNTGINNASGKYLMFIDCDDIVHDNIVELLMNKAYEENYDMVVAAHNLVKEKNGVVYSIVPNVYPERNLAGYKNGDAIMNLPGLPWAKVYKRNLWDNVRFFPGYWYEDTIIQPLIFTQCKSYAYVGQVVYDYKWYESNFTHDQCGKSTPKVIDRYWILTDILEHYKKMKIQDDKVFYTLLLRQLCCFFYRDVRRCPEAVEALFVLAGELLKNNKPKEKVKLPYILRQTEKAFETKNIALWKLASQYNY